MKTSLKSVAAIVLTLSVFNAAALAETIYLATSGTNLYRTIDGSTEQFTLPEILSATAVDRSTGVVYAIGDMGGGKGVYTVENASSGTPTLSVVGTLARGYGAVTMSGGLLYGFSIGDLYLIDLSDPGNIVETLVGDTLVDNLGGAAYDPVSDTMYLGANGTANGRLYTVDYKTAATSLVGPFGIDSDGMGFDWWGGHLYAAVQNGTSGNVEVGQINTSSGAYSSLFELPQTSSVVHTSLSIIPEPGTLGALLLGVAAVIRRRR